MASHFKFYDGLGEAVPFSARYSYPTQANRAWKSAIKIPPKNGGTFDSQTTGTSIRFELPAQGYLNTRHTYLTFDLQLTAATAAANARVQNNIQSIFKRVRILYGSLVLEDIRDYNVLVRMLTEGATNNVSGVSDQGSIADGIGGIKMAFNNPADMTNLETGLINTRLMEIQSSKFSVGTSEFVQRGAVNDGPRRYQVQLALGLFQQNKYLPLKWMASQLAIEIELAPYEECIAQKVPFAVGDNYTLTNMAILAELLEFDGSYDQAFLEGLRGDGVPIKFSSWDTFLYTPSQSDSQTLLIPERNRSLKGMYCVQLPPRRVVSGQAARPWDSHAFLESSSGLSTDTGYASGFLKDFQWRIGGKYFPSQPVVCGTNRALGGAEAYCEFAKAMNIVGDYKLSTPQNSVRWSRPTATGAGESICIDWEGLESSVTADISSTSLGPSAFVIAADLETSNGSEVSGLNGEEQNDIALMIKYSAAQSQTCYYNVYVHYDALLILRENNLVELIK